MTIIGVLGAAAQAAPGEADRLFEAGRELARKGDYAGACEKFTKSYALDPALGTQLNLADCDEHLGKNRAAWELYTAAIVQADKIGDDQRAQYAREHADATAAKLGTLVLDVADPDLAGLSITIDGRRVAPAREVRDRVDPGDVEIAATAPGRETFATKVRAAAGETTLVAIPATLSAPPPPPPHAESPSHDRSHMPLVLGAAAAASAVTAVVIGAFARDDYDGAASGPHCTRSPLVCDGIGASQIHHAQTLGDVATVFGAGAIALGAVATYLYVRAPREPAVAPVATRKTVGLVWTRRF